MPGSLLSAGLAASLIIAGSIGAVVLYSTTSTHPPPPTRANSTFSVSYYTSGTVTTAFSTGPLPSILDAEAANVTINPWPGQMGVDPLTGKVYISDLAANKLTVIDASTRTITSTVTLPGTATFGVAVDAKNDLVYVPVLGCTNAPNVPISCLPGGKNWKGSIVRIDGRNDSITGDFGVSVDRLAIDPAKHVLYGVSSHHLLVIDEQSGAVSLNVSLSATPSDIAVIPGSNTVYVGTCSRMGLACENTQVMAIDTGNGKVLWNAQLGSFGINFGLVANPATNTVYVLGVGTNMTLDSFDGTTGRLIYSSALGSSCSGSGGGVLMDASSNRIYVVSSSVDFFLVVDAPTGRLVSTMTTPLSGGTYNVALNPTTHEVYLTSEVFSHPGNGLFLVLSGAALNAVHHVDDRFLQRGMCFP